MNETYENFNIILNQINYEGHGWMMCGELEIVAMFLGQQNGFFHILWVCGAAE